MKFRLFTTIAFTLVSILTTSNALSAAEGDEDITRFEYYGAKAGLVQNAIFSMMRDANGFLWLGTTNGLIRFDGLEFKSYNGPAYDSQVCVSERINKMWDDAHDFIWMETYDGEIWYFNQRIEQFGGLPTATHELKEDNYETPFLKLNKDTIIIGDGDRGILLLSYNYDKCTYDMRQIAILGAGLKNAITSLSYDKNTGIWIGSENGIFAVNTDEIKRAQPQIATVVENAKTTNATCQTKERIYFGTESDGIVSIEKKSRKVKRIKPRSIIGQATTFLRHINGRGVLATTDKSELFHINKDSCTQIQLSKGHTFGSITSIYIDKFDQAWVSSEKYDLIRYDPFSSNLHFYPIDIPDSQSSNEIEPPCYLEDKDNNLWVGLHGGGLLKFNRKSDKFTQWTNEIYEERSIQSNDIFCMTEDKAGNLWLGTSSNMGSVIKVIGKNKAFSTYQPLPEQRNCDAANLVRSIASDKAGNIYIGTKSCDWVAIDNSDNKTYKTKGFRLSDGSIIKSMPYTIKVAHDNRLWIGTKGSGIFISKLPVPLNRPEITNLTFDQISQNKAKKGLNNIYSIEEEPDGTMWAATFGGGLLRIKTYSDDIEIDTINSKNSELATDKTRFLHIDKDGNLLIATIRGVQAIAKDQLKEESPKISYYKDAPKVDICHISEDANGTIYLASIGNGLTCIHTNGESRTYRRIDGLADNTVYASEQDKHGDTWVSTENGISKLTQNNGQIKTYNDNRGLAFNSYSEATVTSRPDGSVIFGGRNGFTIINPQGLNQPSNIEEINITDIWVNGERQKPEQEGLITESATFTKALHVSSEQSNIVVRFASMDFTDPRSTNFAYRLKGLEDDWRNVGNSNYATYTNLSPGCYRLEICVLDGNEDWTPSKTLDIIVSSPWWKRWWAVTLYVIAALSIAGLALQSWIRLSRYKRLVNQLLEINMTATMRNDGLFDIEPTDKNSHTDLQRPQNNTQITSKEDELISAIIKYAETNYKTVIGMDQLAEHFGMSRTTLFNKVKSATGQSPLDFVRQVKLRLAAEMLRKGYSVSEAAYEIGYSDVKYFSKLYRQIFGYNPSEEKRNTGGIR